MILSKIIDPRSNLEKANRDELREFAERNGIKEIQWWMRGDQMAAILKQKGITDIPLPNRILGLPRSAVAPDPQAPQVEPQAAITLEDLQKQQWSSENPEPPRQPMASQEQIDVSVLPMGKLKKLAKQRGIKQARTDNRETLLAKINGQSHAA